MAMLLILVFFLFIPAAIATGAIALSFVRKPDWTLRRRASVAAGTAGFVPVVPPIAYVLSGNDGGVGPVVPVVALLLLGLAMALVVGLPVALWVGRRRTADRVSVRTFD